MEAKTVCQDLGGCECELPALGNVAIRLNFYECINITLNSPCIDVFQQIETISNSSN